MTGSYSGRFSLKSICMLLCVLVGMSFALQFVEVHDVYAAGMWSNAYGESDPDEAYIQFGFYGFNDGDEITFTIEPDKNDFGSPKFVSGPTSISGLKTKNLGGDEKAVTGTVKYKNKDTYKIKVSGTEIKGMSVLNYS